jgi:hypothetical protein
VSVSLPHVFFNILLGGSKDYYYERKVRTYAVIPPRVGAVVEAVPAGYRVIAVNGVAYYTVDNVYYRYTPQGYMVVAPPAVQVVSPVPVVHSLADAGQSFTVYVPDSRGGYTGVVITRWGSGFIGPQGEFYPEFPGIEQLGVMYSKKR